MERCITCGVMEAGQFTIPTPGHHGDGVNAIYTRADARLIAAAPKLLAAAENAIAILRQGWIPPEHLRTPGEVRAWNDACEAFRDSGMFVGLADAIAQAKGGE